MQSFPELQILRFMFKVEWEYRIHAYECKIVCLLKYLPTFLQTPKLYNDYLQDTKI